MIPQKIIMMEIRNNMDVGLLNCILDQYHKKYKTSNIFYDGDEKAIVIIKEIEEIIIK